MTERDIRLTIAKALGWSAIWEADASEYNDFDLGGIKDGHAGVAPDYPNDLNACHEFEETVGGEDWNQYERHLRAITLRDSQEGTGLDRRLILAAARQRCEAFLRMKGLWKE